MKFTFRWCVWLLLLFAVLYTGGHLSRVANAPSPPTTYWVTDVQPTILDASRAGAASEAKVTIVLGYEGPRPASSTVAALFDFFLVIDDPFFPVRVDKQSLDAEAAIDPKRSEVQIGVNLPVKNNVKHKHVYFRAVPTTDHVKTPPIWVPIRTVRQHPGDVMPLGAVARVDLTDSTSVVPEAGSDEPPIHMATPGLASRLHQARSITGAFFADNGALALLRNKYQVYVWDVASDKVSLVWSNNREVYAAVLSSDSRFLAVSEAKTIWIMDLNARRIVHRLTTDEGNEPAEWIAVTQDGNGVIAVCADTHVYVIDPRDPVHVRGHRELIPDRKRDRFRQAAISIDEDRLATFTEDTKTAQIWSLSTGKELDSLNLKRQKQGPWSGCAFSYDTRRFALAGFGGEVSVWEIGSGKELLRVADLPGIPQSHGPVVFSHDGLVLAVTDANERQVYLLDTRTGEVLLRCPPLSDRGPRSSHVDAISFSKSGRLLIVQSAEVPLRLPGIRSVSRAATVWDLARIRTLRRRFDQ